MRIGFGQNQKSCILKNIRTPTTVGKHVTNREHVTNRQARYQSAILRFINITSSRHLTLLLFCCELYLSGNVGSYKVV